MKNTTVNKSEYPFQSHYIEIEGDKLHYLDEGKGELILFLHGIPDWSFSYRNLIKELSKTHRCIAPDNLGFGLSDAPDDTDYSPQGHLKRLKSFIGKLGLKNIHLYVHDLAGPFGLAYALEHPENIRSITLVNTYMWSLLNDKKTMQAAKIINGGLGRFLYLHLNFSVNFMVPQSFGDKKKLTKEVRRNSGWGNLLKATGWLPMLLPAH